MGTFVILKNIDDFRARRAKHVFLHTSQIVAVAEFFALNLLGSRSVAGESQKKVMLFALKQWKDAQKRG